MSRPQNLSSSVSMFIEDSRVAAVANANVNPVNPAHFYTISAFSHSPNIREASVSHDVISNEGAKASSGTSCCLGSQFVTRPTRLEIRNFPSNRHHDLNLNFSDSLQSPLSGHGGGGGGGGSGSPNNNRRPREIIHTIRRETDGEDNNNCDSNNLSPNQKPCQSQSQNSNSFRNSMQNSNVGSSDTTSGANKATFCANTVVVGVGGGCGSSRRVSLSVQPRMPWNSSSSCNSNVNVFPDNNNQNQSSTGSNTTSTSFIVTSLSPNQNSSIISSSSSNSGNGGAKCVHVMKPAKSKPQREDRSFTSVNLTLKSPTSGGGCGSVAGSITQQVLNNDSNCEYSCSTAISSPHGPSSGNSTSTATTSNNIRRTPAGVHCKNSVIGSNGSSLTYSSYSNFRDGFESQLQIQIGPHGGSISASRRRNSGNPPSSNSNCPGFPGSELSNADYNNSMQQMNADLLAAQLERKQKLETSLNSERIRLVKLRGEIASLRSRFQRIPDLERLKNKNQVLRLECDLMTKQVDLYDNGTVPLGETSEEFYREINPGQDANSLIWSMSAETTATGGRWPRGSSGGGVLGSGRGKPPPRPPPPRILHLNPPQNHHTNNNNNNNSNDTQSGEWCCFMCTFRNHPDLDQCEQCQMVRVRPSNSPASGAHSLPYYQR